MNEGYFRTPHVLGDDLVFVSEDDLWTAPLAGGLARRLTAALGDVSFPRFSPDGRWVAYTGRDELHFEVWSMPLRGGRPRRLTYLGANSFVCGWSPDGQVLFRSDHAQPALKKHLIFGVSPEGGQPEARPWGVANEVSFGPRGGVVLGRNTVDPARWKRYRGGTAGHLWVDPKGKGRFQRILGDLPTNIAHPMWIGNRIYFVSDHEGIGNIYSCDPSGGDLRRHTDHDQYYARFASTDGRTIVYQHAAEIWALEVEGGSARRVDVELASPRTQRNRRFVDAASYLHSYAVHPKGHSLAVEARGRAFTMGLWEGAVRQYGGAGPVRHRFPQWLADGERLVALSDEGGEEGLDVFVPDGSRLDRLDDLDLGIAHLLTAAPRGNLVAVANNRLELIVIDVETRTRTVVDRSEHERIDWVTWSPDAAWLAYSFQTGHETRAIKVAEVSTGRTHQVTRPGFRDYSPAFDPDGKYLFFLSWRTFDPVYDSYFFDLGFPRGSRPYAIALRKDVPNPFVATPRGFGDTDDAEAAKADPSGSRNGTKQKQKGKDDAPASVVIDFDGIEDRVAAFPVPLAQHGELTAVKGKVLFTTFQPEGALGGAWWDKDDSGGTLDVFDFERQKHEVLLGGVADFLVSADRSTLVYRGAGRLRALKAGEKPDAQYEKDPPSRQSGWIDIGRIRVGVDPGVEWEQMYMEAWRLQRENFWAHDMSGVDWEHVRERYRPLLPKVSSRAEFSDLMWEMQGELGTSHAYDMLGDYRSPPPYPLGYLAADVSWNARAGGWRIDHIVRGDPWDEQQNSPLAALGVNVSEGDTIVAVNGRRTDERTPPQALLVNQAGQTVELLVADARGRSPRPVLVKTLVRETPARYREWVERNRARVHEATDGRVGYVHVPDMGPAGYAEFHRYYYSEVERDALIVDVRFNGGGHVSQIILEKLTRKRIGYDVPRWGKPEPYPSDSVLGPIIAITDEQAGSDGDIFSHCFKLLKIGPLVGKRTWGGVVGIWVRHVLADNGIVTQPEMAFWFNDVGWKVENYGTDPDYDVDITPQDYAEGRDPQMEKALALMKEALRRTPPKLPDFGKRPRLTLPRLPKRKGLKRS